MKAKEEKETHQQKKGKFKNKISDPIYITFVHIYTLLSDVERKKALFFLSEFDRVSHTHKVDAIQLRYSPYFLAFEKSLIFSSLFPLCRFLLLLLIQMLDVRCNYRKISFFLWYKKYHFFRAFWFFRMNEKWNVHFIDRWMNSVLMDFNVFVCGCVNISYLNVLLFEREQFFLGEFDVVASFHK